jgi:hypothetical protein
MARKASEYKRKAKDQKRIPRARRLAQVPRILVITKTEKVKGIKNVIKGRTKVGTKRDKKQTAIVVNMSRLSSSLLIHHCKTSDKTFIL